MLISVPVQLVRFLRLTVTFAKIARLYTAVTLAQWMSEAKYLFRLRTICLMVGAHRSLTGYTLA